ncbi:TRAP transporter small permease [Salinicola sp. MIT1003]|uniref:TRAP transporter small permease subunit n=1 Tax=Salinicola sp. MIT1003 TaxID=1882734 RepID=UPI00147B015C|nr:TRAP transporter small permease [Salinicola sp. MIT1003]
MNENKTPLKASYSANAPQHCRGARLLLALNNVVIKLSNIMLCVSGLSVVVILIIGAADTVGRAFWNKPVVGAVEISEALLAVSIFSALAYAQKQGSHVAVDIFSSNYGPRLARWARKLILTVTLVVLGFLLWRTGITAYEGWLNNEVSAGLFRVPIWLAKIVAAAGLLVACMECVRELMWAMAQKLDSSNKHSVGATDIEN